MNEFELVTDPIERLGMAQEQISVRLEVGVEVLDDTALGIQIEIDQDVGAKDQVHAFQEQQARVVEQIQTREADDTFHRRIHL